MKKEKYIIRTFFIVFLLSLNYHLKSQSEENKFNSEIRFFSIEKIESEINLDVEEITKIILEEFQEKKLELVENFKPYIFSNETPYKPNSIILVNLEIKRLNFTFQCAEIKLTIKDYFNTPIYSQKTTCSGIELVKRTNCIESIKKETQLLCRNVQDQDINSTMLEKQFEETRNFVNSEISQDSLIKILNSNINSICGIYESIDTIGAIYNFGIIKDETAYKLILLDSNHKLWKPGYIKGVINEYQINEKLDLEFQIEWYQNGHKTLHPNAEISNNSLMTIEFNEKEFKRKKYFIKTYPK